MGSGYFPLSDGENADKLRQAVKLLGEVTDVLWEDIYSGSDGQFDNAASDGGNLALLGLAQELITRCVFVEKK